MADPPSLRHLGSLPRRVGRRLLSRRNDRQRLRRSRRAADEACARVRAALGRTDLDAATSRRIREYGAEVLGSPDFAPWLRFYTLYRGRFLEGWIPADFYRERVVPGLYRDRAPVGEKRTLSRRLFGSDAFPDVAYLVGGRWFTTDFDPIAPDELLDRVFARSDEVYLKPEGSARGNGVRRVGRADFAGAVRHLGRNCVAQRPVVQHPDLARIYPGAVATLRLTTTWMDDGGPRVRGVLLKVGAAGSTHVDLRSALLCTVVDGQGTLGEHGFDHAWHPHARHPDTGFVFAGARVPCLAEAVATCLRLHARLPHDPLIGWDVSVTPTGAVEVMEWNSGPVGIACSEAVVGPLFADCGFERFAGDARGAGRR